MIYISIIFFSFLFSQNCLLYNSCDDCYDAGCFWQPTEVIGEQCFDECMIADLSCYGQTNSWTAECPQETVLGYLKSVEISSCMDECSQYYIEFENNTFEPINVISQNSFVDIGPYINRFVEISLGAELNCVECSAFEIEQINLSDECLFPVSCFVDPCEIAGECTLNTSADCISNYCGGCYADFYDLSGSLIQCDSDIVNPCDDLQDISFGMCDMVLGVAVVNNQCEVLSGCGWSVDEVDYSEAFFNSLDECETECLNEPYICGNIEYDYAQMHDGIYSECDTDNDCISIWGDCSVGLGGCHYSINSSTYNQTVVNDLVDLWLENDCMDGVCDCMPLPDSFCNEGICDLGYCIEENPAGCFSTGCPDNYSCIDYEEGGDCVPSTCYCDEFYGGWYCTEDCNGGTCFQYGDVNYDFSINVSDIVSIVNMILGIVEFSSLSDINFDNTTNVGDIVALVNIILN
ncbi:MAG: hypothetical protein CMG64_01490 [Candidatus Marinimicrobia bacterium]|nr:hypothetical protein [Candidatus Neomarinimicrobiota bacterium]|tara:strand:+ start:10605 stop:11990 length:1386 start_codon:yes stop_codon:yes gene_type:complete